MPVLDSPGEVVIGVLEHRPGVGQLDLLEPRFVLPGRHGDEREDVARGLDAQELPGHRGVTGHGPVHVDHRAKADFGVSDRDLSKILAAVEENDRVQITELFGNP